MEITREILERLTAAQNAAIRAIVLELAACNNKK
jgi:hypothetical protein